MKNFAVPNCIISRGLRWECAVEAVLKKFKGESL